MRFYPIAQTISILPGTINRIYTIYYKDYNNFPLMLMQTTFDTLRGFCVAIIFLNTPLLKTALFTCCYRLFRKKKENDYSNKEIENSDNSSNYYIDKLSIGTNYTNEKLLPNCGKSDFKGSI